MIPRVSNPLETWIQKVQDLVKSDSEWSDTLRDLIPTGYMLHALNHFEYGFKIAYIFEF